MFSIIPVNSDHVMAFKASGTLTDADYQEFLPQLEEMIRSEGPLAIYVDMSEFEGWEAKAAWDDFKFGMRHTMDFSRMAVVGDKKWLSWMMKISAIFFKGEVRVFPSEQSKQAMDWLLQQNETTSNTSQDIKPPKPYNHIMVATDFSRHAKLALYRGMELAEKYDARLSLVHAFDTYYLYDDFMFDGSMAMNLAPDQQEMEQFLEDNARKQLLKLADELGLADPKNTHLLRGPVKPTLLDFAGEHGVDLIVMGSHGRHGVERLIGSVAAGMVNKADCEVLTVKLP